MMKKKNKTNKGLSNKQTLIRLEECLNEALRSNNEEYLNEYYEVQNSQSEDEESNNDN